MRTMAEATIAELAPAKVNLYLHVTGRRRDGYHLLDSLVVFAAIADTVRVVPGVPFSFTLDGANAGGLATEPDNLVLRAARMLAASVGRVSQGAISLSKTLPVAAGLGGGSADAAATLRALDRAWKLGMRHERLMTMAVGLGADVPVCIASRPRRMAGIGDVLNDAPVLPRFGLVLANPRTGVSTAAVFSARRGPYSPRAALPRAWSDAEAMANDLASQRNDLEEPACFLCPPVAEVLAALGALPGALLARMSGSGATCFAIMRSPEEAEVAARQLPEAWWRWGGGLHTHRRP